MEKVALLSRRRDEPERQHVMGLPMAPLVSQMKGGFMKFRWIIDLKDDKPAWIHPLVWNQYSESSRKCHVRWLHRVKNIDPELADCPLSAAIIEMVLRLAAQKGWAWTPLTPPWAPLTLPSAA